MKRGAKVGLAVVAGLVCLTAVMVVVAHHQHPRTLISQKLKFLAGIEPTKTELRTETGVTLGSKKPFTATSLTERFDLPLSADDVCKQIEADMGNAFNAFILGPPAEYYGYISQGSIDLAIQVKIRVLGSHHSTLTLTENQEDRNLLDRILACLRRVTGGS